MMTNAQATEIRKTATMAIKKTAAQHGRQLPLTDVEDIAQATVIKLLESFDASKGAVGALAYTAAKNLTVDFLRGRSYAGASKDGHSADLGTTDDEGNHVEIDTADESLSVLATMVLNETYSKVAIALAKLAPCHREALSVYLADERTMTGGERIAKKRAIAALQELV